MAVRPTEYVECAADPVEVAHIVQLSSHPVSISQIRTCVRTLPAFALSSTHVSPDASMRRLTARALSLLALSVLLAGCGVLGSLLGGGLTEADVIGRYRITEYRIAPAAPSLSDHNLDGDEALPRNATFNFLSDNRVIIEVITNRGVDETVASGAWSISDSDVRVDFTREPDNLLPERFSFAGSGDRLTAEIELEGIDLSEVDDDYRGITAADATMHVRLEKLGE